MQSLNPRGLGRQGMRGGGGNTALEHLHSQSNPDAIARISNRSPIKKEKLMSTHKQTIKL